MDCHFGRSSVTVDARLILVCMQELTQSDDFRHADGRNLKTFVILAKEILPKVALTLQ
jgi:hypothetical protein